jgi:hypothetical protein
LALDSHQMPELAYLEGGFASPAGKPPRGLEFPAISRTAWRFGALTQRCRLVPLLGTGSWEEGPPPRREIISRGAHNGRSGWFSGGSNSIPCAQVITPGVGACGVGSGQEIENWQITPRRLAPSAAALKRLPRGASPPGDPIATQAARNKPETLSPTSQKSTALGMAPSDSPLEGYNCPEITPGELRTALRQSECVRGPISTGLA